MISLLEQHGIKKGQKEVDFVIPFLDQDRRYFLDPALLRFSRTPLLIKWNQEIKDFLDLTRHVMKKNDLVKLVNLLSIGEAGDVGLGYCAEGIGGSGVGNEISKNILKILRKNPEFRKRGLLRLEELQWMDVDIGPDRISDLTVNILKRDIIKYTQQQCRKHGIPMEEVRVQKVFLPDELGWGSEKTKLPVNPLITVRDVFNPHPPVLLVPKEIVKPLPLFLNYSDFYGFIESEKPSKASAIAPKTLVARTVVEDPELSTRYIHHREAEKDKLLRPDFDEKGLIELEKLEKIETGRKQANEYRATVARILTAIFPHLPLYREEKQTLLGDKQRDIILQNNATSADSIFTKLRVGYGADHIVVDAKNTEHVTPDDIARVASYLNKKIGMVGLIVSRKRSPTSRLLKHAKAYLDDDGKVILFICDEELKKWLNGKSKIQHTTGEDISTYDAEKSIANKYSELVSS